MTQERFSRIVDDPELLRTITYEELKTLALAYPYAHNLWYFLAIKARQIDHPDVVKNIATAAAYSLDRTQLFRLVAPQMIAPQEVWMEEEVLELKPIETLKRKLEEELTTVERSESKPVAEAAMSIVPEVAEPLLQSVAPPPPEEPESIILEVSYLTYHDWYNRFNLPLITALAVVPDAALSIEAIVPETSPVQETTAQTIDHQPIESDEEEEENEQPKGKPGSIAQILAEKSVSENKDVISETLAKLFAKQGFREKAITMYERLILAFPEKSAYFAAEIDKLKK
ncbi:MAG: hypothetical protein JNJ57_10330 [Saprospiraceae bacterium]|nr:hypothetical protein [Saprospiraceae bacterium]